VFRLPSCSSVPPPASRLGLLWGIRRFFWSALVALLAPRDGHVRYTSLHDLRPRRQLCSVLLHSRWDPSSRRRPPECEPGGGIPPQATEHLSASEEGGPLLKLPTTCVRASRGRFWFGKGGPTEAALGGHYRRHRCTAAHAFNVTAPKTLPLPPTHLPRWHTALNPTGKSH